MIRSALLASLALSCAAADGWDRIESNQGSIGFAVHSTTSSNVSVGPMEKSWSEATRGEIYFRSYYPVSEGVQPFFEGALFEDKQSYSDADGRVDCDTFGLGLTFGGTVMPVESRGRISLGIMPYVRFAFGSSDVYIRDLQFEDQEVDASGTVGRLDFGGGADVRLTLGRHLEAAIGGGINFWRSADIDAVVTDKGTLVRVNESVDFSGHDVFLRVSAGFSF
jgi:hypothetical protein